MKNIVHSFFAIVMIIMMNSCAKDMEEINYTPNVTINFSGVADSNIVQVDKGILEYTADIQVKSTGTKISRFEIYQADPRTGVRGALIEGTSKFFDEGASSYSMQYLFTNLTENKNVKVVVTDTLGNNFEKNLFVKISPSVIMSNDVQIETVENYYGPYYGSWLSGRVYMRKDEAYKSKIDFSLGDIVIAPGDTIPALVNPAARGALKLLTMDGLQNTKFELTTFTRAQYLAVTQIDALPITSLPDPQKETVRLENNKVYVFKTASGKKGLISVTALTKKVGTIESVNNQWIAGTSYYQATLSTKTVTP